MSSFTSELAVTPTYTGRDWKLVRPFIYHVGSKYSKAVVKVPAGFVTDFASIPKFIWILPYWAKYSKAPVVHDALYTYKSIQGKPITRKRADKIFHEAMLVSFRHHKLGPAVAFIEYWTVRLFGWLAWRKGEAAG